MQGLKLAEEPQGSQCVRARASKGELGNEVRGTGARAVWRPRRSGLRPPGLTRSSLAFSGSWAALQRVDGREHLGGCCSNRERNEGADRAE